jgi:hypothetical protein
VDASVVPDVLVAAAVVLLPQEVYARRKPTWPVSTGPVWVQEGGPPPVVKTRT